MDTFLEHFHQLMSNRIRAVIVMLCAAAGAIVTIAAGYYGTFQIVTLLSNN